MIGFLIKKAFFDLWDNLFRIALVNLGFIACMAFLVYLPGLFEGIPALNLGLLFFGILGSGVYLAAAAESVKALSDYGSFGFGDFFNNLKKVWPMGLVWGGIVLVFTYLITFVLPAYVSLNSLLGLVLGVLVFWLVVIGILSLQFFFPIRARLDTKIGKILKKSFIFFFDNTGFCIFSLFCNFIALVLSVFLVFLFPGPAGILLFLDEGLRLRLLKYDWLEANPQADRKKIPWDALLIEEREKTGTRSLKSFIFPWKD
jgi:hypothetical protein